MYFASKMSASTRAMHPRSLRRMAAVRVGSGRVKYCGGSGGSGGSGGPCQAVRAVQAVHVEYFDRTKVIVSKNQIVVPPGNNVFDIFEGIGCQLRFQILIRMKRADPCFGVCSNSAWSPSYEKFI